MPRDTHPTPEFPESAKNTPLRPGLLQQEHCKVGLWFRQGMAPSSATQTFTRLLKDGRTNTELSLARWGCKTEMTAPPGLCLSGPPKAGLSRLSQMGFRKPHSIQRWAPVTNSCSMDNLLHQHQEPAAPSLARSKLTTHRSSVG